MYVLGRFLRHLPAARVCVAQRVAERVVGGQRADRGGDELGLARLVGLG